MFVRIGNDEAKYDLLEESGIFRTLAPKVVSDLNQDFVRAGLDTLAAGDRMIEATVRVQRSAADNASCAIRPCNLDRESLRGTAVRDIDAMDGYSAWHMFSAAVMASGHSSR